MMGQVKSLPFFIMKKGYRKIQKNLTKEEADRMLSSALSQRQVCVEALYSVRMSGLDPLTSALCKRSLMEFIEENTSQIEWLDKRIDDLRRFTDSRITDLMG